MNPIAELVIKRIIDALMYIPSGCKWAICIVSTVLAVGLILRFGLHKKIPYIFWLRLIAYFFFIIYAYCVLQLTIFNRESGNFGGIDWRLFARWHENDAQKAFLIANIIMFIPLGILMPFLCKWTKHILISLPIATLSSIAIEAIQLKYQIGSCQLDDVVVNTLGFLIGFLVYLIIADIYWFIFNIIMLLTKAIKLLIKELRKID